MDKYLVALGKFTKLGPKRFSQLFSYFKDAKSIWHGTPSDFMEAGLNEKIALELREHIQKTEPEKEAELLERYNIKVTSVSDDNYPQRLKEIFSPPFVLYVRGELKKEEDCLGVVGARKPTDYGAEVTRSIVQEISNSKITIVSGLALGIDTITHRATVQNKGRTIAVLGCGLDRVYPSSNVNLAKEILETGGAIISEYPLGAPPLKHHFPARNRIISGLSLGVLITEAAKGSGSLFTARDALEQGREIFAVPGDIYNKNSIGPNSLIKMGAKAVTEAKDILEELNLEFVQEKQKAKKIYPATKEESLIIEILENEPKHIDEIIKVTGIETHNASSTLTLMEIKGKVRHLGGMVYAIGK